MNNDIKRGLSRMALGLSRMALGSVPNGTFLLARQKLTKDQLFLSRGGSLETKRLN
jgi:hypothetical protein